MQRWGILISFLREQSVAAWIWMERKYRWCGDGWMEGRSDDWMDGRSDCQNFQQRRRIQKLSKWPIKISRVLFWLTLFSRMKIFVIFIFLLTNWSNWISNCLRIRVWQDSRFSYLEFFSCKTDFIFGISVPKNGILGKKKSKNYNFRFEWKNARILITHHNFRADFVGTFEIQLFTLFQ